MECQICGRSTEYYNKKIEHKKNYLEEILSELSALRESESAEEIKEKIRILNRLNKFNKELSGIRISTLLKEQDAFLKIDPEIHKLEEILQNILELYSDNPKINIILHANDRTHFNMGLGGHKEIYNIYDISISELLKIIRNISINKIVGIREEEYIKQRIEMLLSYTKIYSMSEIIKKSEQREIPVVIPRLDLTRIGKGMVEFEDLNELYDIKVCFVCKNIFENYFTQIDKVDKKIMGHLNPGSVRSY